MATIPDYPSNDGSIAKKEEKPKVEKVVTGEVKVKKKSGFHKLTDIFIKEDIGSVREYVIGDVIIPTIRNLMYDVFENSLRMIFLNGEPRRSGSGYRTGQSTSRVSYASYYGERDRDRRDKASDRKYYRSVYSFDDIIFADRAEADEVLDRLQDLIETYGVASVGDFYDLIGKVPSYTDNRYGWENISNATVVRMRDGGYMIRLPKARPLD